MLVMPEVVPSSAHRMWPVSAGISHPSMVLLNQTVFGLRDKSNTSLSTYKTVTYAYRLPWGLVSLLGNEV
ncbi:hypothetical protein DPEC_G00073060 [Dallia pectoralis]|uniref:Uncharacterized protein n=1 Tax=Dallia pectoralis TaxID=75939 RepID=A0ACC2H3E3_DALPE|nr:hypothetical protein DPEC_G00073060 [Dallia pectoralis]